MWFLGRSPPLQRIAQHVKNSVKLRHVDRVQPILPLDPLSQFKIDLKEWVDSNDGTPRQHKLIAKEKN